MDRDMTIENLKQIHQVLPALSRDIMEKHLQYTIQCGNYKLSLDLFLAELEKANAPKGLGDSLK